MEDSVSHEGPCRHHLALDSLFFFYLPTESISAIQKYLCYIVFSIVKNVEGSDFSYNDSSFF